MPAESHRTLQALQEAFTKALDDLQAGREREKPKPRTDIEFFIEDGFLGVNMYLSTAEGTHTRTSKISLAELGLAIDRARSIGDWPG